MKSVKKTNMFFAACVVLFGVSGVYGAEEVYGNEDEYVKECLTQGKKIGSEGKIKLCKGGCTVEVGMYSVINHIRTNYPEDIAQLRPNPNADVISNKKAINRLLKNSYGKVVKGRALIDTIYPCFVSRSNVTFENAFCISEDMAYDLPEGLNILGHAIEKDKVIVMAPDIKKHGPKESHN